MKYWGEFRTIHDNTKYKVEFFDEGSATSYGDELILGDNPCIISRQSNNLFDPIKPHTCTIEIYTKEFLPALYNYRPHGIEVKVTRDPGNTEYITFHGFVTPCMYTQSFTYADTIQIECIDAISTLQYFNYTYENGQYAQNLSVYSILKRACQVARTSFACTLRV